MLDSLSPVLDGLSSAAREAELLNEEAQHAWQDERGQRTRQMYLEKLLSLQSLLPNLLTGLLAKIGESDLMLQKARDTHHFYGQSEASHAFHLTESVEERHRTFHCVDLSRSQCNASNASVQRVSSLINAANNTSLHF